MKAWFETFTWFVLATVLFFAVVHITSFERSPGQSVEL